MPTSQFHYADMGLFQWCKNLPKNAIFQRENADFHHWTAYFQINPGLHHDVALGSSGRFLESGSAGRCLGMPPTFFGLLLCSCDVEGTQPGYD